MIISFGPLIVEDDGSVRTDCSLAQAEGLVAWAVERGMRFARNAAGDWELVETLWEAMT